MSEYVPVLNRVQMRDVILATTGPKPAALVGFPSNRYDLVDEVTARRGGEMRPLDAEGDVLIMGVSDSPEALDRLVRAYEANDRRRIGRALGYPGSAEAVHMHKDSQAFSDALRDSIKHGAPIPDFVSYVDHHPAGAYFDGMSVQIPHDSVSKALEYMAFMEATEPDFHQKLVKAVVEQATAQAVKAEINSE